MPENGIIVDQNDTQSLFSHAVLPQLTFISSTQHGSALNEGFTQQDLGFGMALAESKT
jgi:hypothetical protein